MLRLTGVVTNLGAFTLAVDSLELASGEYLIILGPNGAGKTVLLETIAGLHPLAAGRIEFQEEAGWLDVSEWPPEKRRVGFVYQDYLLFPHLSVADNIGFGLRSRITADGRTARVGETAALTRVEGLLGRRISGLSGGEQQRVALARALAIRPRLLLLDEPLAALDRTARREMADETKRLCHDLGVTVLHVTHSLEEAVSLGHRVAVIAAGRLLQVGSPRELMQAPASKRVAELLGCENLLEGVLHGSEVSIVSGPTLVTTANPDHQVAGRVIVALRAEELTLHAAPDSSPIVAGSNLFPGIVEALEPGPVHWTVRIRYVGEPGPRPVAEQTLGDVGAAASPVRLAVSILPPELTRLAVHPGSQVGVHVEHARVRICPP